MLKNFIAKLYNSESIMNIIALKSTFKLQMRILTCFVNLLKFTSEYVRRFVA